MKNQLLGASLSESTQHSYARFWSRFTNFIASQPVSASSLPASSDTVSSFVAYLYLQKYAPSTISSHLSAISYKHSINQHPDPCDSFIVRKMVLGAHKSSKSVDKRQPLLLADIHHLCTATTIIFLGVPYLQSLSQAVLLTAFHGFFRMGELLPSKLSGVASVVQFSHVTLRKNSVHISLHHHKTNKSNKPITIILPSQPHFCPVKALRTYISLRGTKPGPLFTLADRSALTQSKFRNHFNALLQFIKLPPKFYKFHSIRIGACTQAVLSGKSEQDIMLMGRWKSRAYRRYIRLSHITSNTQ